MSTRRQPPRDKRRRLRRLALGLLLASAALAGLGFVAFQAAAVALDPLLPPILTVADYRRHALQTTRIHAADGTLLTELWRERRTVVRGGDLPRVARLAAVAAEDGDFYQHGGLDLAGILRAAAVNLREWRLSQGASTITQQVARSFYLTQDKTLTRKLLEVFLARKLERHLTKDEILELYLNQIYFGHGRWGIEEAARHYLGRSAATLDAADAALLMGLVPAPERLNPFDDPAGARRRRDRVLREMAARGLLPEADAVRAMRGGLRLAPPREEGVIAPWFVDVIRRRLGDALGDGRVLDGGLDVYTTLQPRAQRAVDAAVASALGAGPAQALATPESAPEVAVVLLDAASRHVVALVGGRDASLSQFNRAVQARRQAGSTFKPFVYGAALESGEFTPGSTYPNRVVCYPGARRWCPENAGGSHDGRATRLDDALAGSLNVVAVQLMRDVGVAAVTDFARRAGLRSPIPPDLSTALGSADLQPLELANAYATLADEGRAADAVFITRVESRYDGRLVHAEVANPRRVLAAAAVRTLESMLVQAVEGGTGRAAALEGHRVAGKTGTTDRRVDVWFAGWATPGSGAAGGPIVGVVWIGHDDRTPLQGASGGGTAAPLWADAMRRLLAPGPSAASTSP